MGILSSVGGLVGAVPQQKGEDVLAQQPKDKYPSVVKYQQQLEADTADDARTEEEGRCLTESADEIDEAIENYKAKNGRFFEPDISEDSEEYSDLRSPEAEIMDSFLGDISTAESSSLARRQSGNDEGQRRLEQSDASQSGSKNLNTVRLSKDEVFQRYGAERRQSLRAEGLAHVTMPEHGSEYWATEARQGAGQRQGANDASRAQMLEDFGYAVLMEEHGLLSEEEEEKGLHSGQQSPGGGVPPSRESSGGVMRMLEDNAFQVLMEEGGGGGGTTSDEELESMLGAALGPADDEDIEEIPRAPPSFDSRSPEIMPIQRNIGVMKMLEEDGFEVLFESDEDGRRTGEGSEMSDDPGLAHAQHKGEEVDSPAEQPQRFSFAGSSSSMGGRFGDDNNGRGQGR
ncbi:hypothetical protein CBR_g45297 [Chara braunii]|uniref:Uncharacterized protein n=1 Tax=Chara braunii TaxID=69332 RepID=A0A388LY37_CHABU|nr:hypothetical protein CBR_g45297 [Chara braunii]|eukprot:GBG87238.1 hypothetical protein CBR_g45297 [Chara braunii]